MFKVSFSICNIALSLIKYDHEQFLREVLSFILPILRARMNLTWTPMISGIPTSPTNLNLEYFNKIILFQSFFTIS